MDTKPTKPIPIINTITPSLRDEGDDILLDVLEQQEEVLKRSRSQLLIIDLSHYRVNAATPRHIKAVDAWLAAQEERCEGRRLDVALVIDKTLLPCAWRLLGQGQCEGRTMAIFSDVSLAYQWAHCRLQGNKADPEGSNDARRTDAIGSPPTPGVSSSTP